MDILKFSLLLIVWVGKLPIQKLQDVHDSNYLKPRHVDMWTLSDSGFSSRTGLSPLIDLVFLLYEIANEKIENIREMREDIERFFKKHIDQWRIDYPPLDQIIKFVEMGLANYEVLRSFTQVSRAFIFINTIITNRIILDF